MNLPPFDLLRPSTLAEALELRSEDHVAFGGGTELLLAMRMGLLVPDALIDVKRLPELGGITFSENQVRIGAAVTHDQVASNEIVSELLPVLAHVCAHVGNPRVRVQGTVGGNVVFAEPKSDVIPALIALDAVVELRSARGARTLSLPEFIEGPYWTDVQEDELLVEVRVPVVPGRQVIYEKFQTMERPTVGVALRRDQDGTCRLVVAAVCGEPFVYDATSTEAIDVDDIANRLDVIEDLTGGEAYKRHLTAVVIRRALALLQQEEA